MIKQRITFVVACFCFAIAAPVHAAGGDPFAKVAEDADFMAGKKAIAEQNWKAAIGSFTRATNKHREEPDVYNMLGYSYRKAGDLDNAFRHYNAALRLDANHKAAHEYIGEAYLMKGDLPSAEKHLATLERLCGKDCEEYADLSKSIAGFKAKK